MSKDILPAVKYTLSFLWVQVKDEVRCVVGIALLISVTRDKYWMQCNTVPQWAAANKWFCQDWKWQQSPQTSEWVLSSLWSSSSPPDVPRSTMNKRQINTANRLPLAEVLPHWSSGTSTPPGHVCWKDPRRCTQHQLLLPGRPWLPSSHSIPPSFQQ